jgi:8-amino-3,8-dideoxy-alpha-D-manno-octulosonate transaminase
MKNSASKLAIDGGKPVRTKPIPPNYPGAAVIGKEERKAVMAVLQARSPFRYYGEHLLNQAKQFDLAFAKYMGAKYGLGVTSGTAALRVAVEALGIGPGDEVIIPSMTFVASANAVICGRAVPIFAEIDETMNLDPEDFERKITKRTKAVMPIPLVGVAPRMDRIKAIARKHGIAILEDVAQSCGATFKGKYLGTFGDIGTFSLQLNKIITAGEGGVVITNNPIIYERAVRYHDQGQVRGVHAAILNNKLRVHPFAGENYRMNEMSAAVALEQLKKLKSIIRKMRAARGKIDAAAGKLKGITLRPSHDRAGDAGNTFGMVLEEGKLADRFALALQAEGVYAHTLYGGGAVYMNEQVRGKDVASTVKCPYECPMYKGKVEYYEGLCPKSEELAKRAIFIGLSPADTAQDVKDIIAAIKKVHAAYMA